MALWIGSLNQEESDAGSAVAVWAELDRQQEAWKDHYDHSITDHQYPWSTDFCELRLSEINREMNSLQLRFSPSEFLKIQRKASMYFYRQPKGSRLADRTTAPLIPSDSLEVIFERDIPTDHIAIAPDGRIFGDTYNHQRSSRSKIIVYDPQTQSVTPFPSLLAQAEFDHIHSLRVDKQNRLWLLDSGKGYFVKPALFAFEIESGKKVFEYRFSMSEAGSGSMLNDFVIDEKAEKIYITDTSPMASKPALLVLDLKTLRSRRILENHVSVRATSLDTYLDYEGGKRWVLPGLLSFISPKIAVDGIAFDENRRVIYYSPGNSGEIYALDASDATDVRLTDRKLAQRVRRIAQSTMTDGMAIDEQGRLYLTDREHSAIVRVDPATGGSETLFKDATRLSWLSTLAFDPNGRLVFTSFPLSQMIFESPESIQKWKRSWPVFRINYGSR